VSAAFDQVAGVITGGVQRVRGDHRVGEVDLVQHRGEPSDLAGLLLDLPLTEHDPIPSGVAGGVGERGQQVHPSTTSPRECATHRLPVHRDRSHWHVVGLTRAIRPTSGVVDQPTADRGIQQVTVHLLGQPPHGGLLRRQVTVLANVEPGIKYRQHALRGIGDPFPDRGERPRTRQHRRRSQRQQRTRRVPHTPPSTRIRYPTEIIPQVSHLFRHDHRLGARTGERGQSIKRSRDQARFHHGHGSPTIMRHQQSHDQRDRARPVNWVIDFADPLPCPGGVPPCQSTGRG
jgi:hypothetical protein